MVFKITRDIVGWTAICSTKQIQLYYYLTLKALIRFKPFHFSKKHKITRQKGILRCPQLFLYYI